MYGSLRTFYVSMYYSSSMYFSLKLWTRLRLEPGVILRRTRVDIIPGIYNTINSIGCGYGAAYLALRSRRA